MIKATEIKDKEALEAWLTDWPAAQGMSKDEAQQVCTTIAHRAALRVLPLALEWFSGPDARERALTALPLFWSVSISGGASICPPSEMGSWEIVADAAANSANSAALSADPAYSAAYFAANSASLSALSVISATLSAAGSANFAARSAANSALWDEVRRDAETLEAGSPLITAPLWAGEVPDAIAAAEARFIENLTADGPQWDFWLRWYDRAGTSDPMPWQLILEIANIEKDEWEGPDAPTRIAERIAGIEVEFFASQTQMGETVSVNPETGKLKVEDDGADNANRLASCVAKLTEINALIAQYDNYKGMLRAEIFLIQRAIEHHPANPVILHNNAKAARAVLAGNIANGSCPTFDEEPVLGLLDTTLLDIQDTLKDEPSVVEASGSAGDMSKIAGSSEVRKHALAAAQDLSALSEGRLAVELVEDAQIVADENNPVALREEAARALSGRSVRIWIAARYATFKKGLDEVADVSKKLGIVSASLTGVGGVAYTVWAQITGSASIAELVKAFLSAM